MNKMVSIVMPVYNREKIIQKTLDSVIAQTFQNWECIIVDDGSTDQTVSLLKEIASQDSRFQIFQRDDSKLKGAPSCRNIGIENAVGDFIIFLDSDDTLEVDCLKSRVSYFEKNEQDTFLVFPMGISTGDNIIKKEIRTDTTFLQDFLSYKLPWSIMSPIWKSEFVKSLKGFKEGYPRLNDPELMIRALLTPGVSYKVFNEVPYDTVYYPSVSNWVMMIDKYYDSLQLFIPDISNELTRRRKTDLKKFLKGYLKVWYRDFYFPSNKNLIAQNRNLIKLFRQHHIINFMTSLKLKCRLYLFILLSFINRKIKNSQIANLG
ncbi:glycosyltransferase family 2 protein [Dokdonia sinensis]|uniref:Glycosyltransferase family 2 protein n=1 Tax=Dokdonia sinensis TaxID=2479847 RepID=A0A3M0G6N3_9FLAO|nr:glycosyltransferase family 2 protein [Dokdonia sinensis]RMB57423.1 glycosyltransferase family 2 protein [Dokdonia sinensis]